jgi:hypothetical protein
MKLCRPTYLALIRIQNNLRELSKGSLPKGVENLDIESGRSEIWYHNSRANISMDYERIDKLSADSSYGTSMAQDYVIKS